MPSPRPPSPLHALRDRVLTAAPMSTRQATAKHCMHGAKCKAGESCEAGKRLKTVHILSGSTLPIWNTVENALKQSSTSRLFTNFTIVRVAPTCPPAATENGKAAADAEPTSGDGGGSDGSGPQPELDPPEPKRKTRTKKGGKSKGAAAAAAKASREGAAVDAAGKRVVGILLPPKQVSDVLTALEARVLEAGGKLAI